ncbi:hypothetical protein BJ138DRAFT_1091930 [Hygrophoropsis aurantiaca]|uniref:Uncharacterized protein n=1 Tax=Hygrophoropsis aurantiaca TaxID=72124 RepID=A0ACB8A4H9_9AGAM|nr:hypothetical protein BJ138DRAFT_1091930 [Hygrophoropsis aurantiaca]
MADYDFRPGGSLKLKGGVKDGGVVKKKKKSKSKSTSKSEVDAERDRVKELLFAEDINTEGRSPSASGSGRNSPAASGSKANDRKTDAERRFEEVQKRRLADKVAKMAHKTHKDRVAELNAKLESLSEHHDIPKVGPG